MDYPNGIATDSNDRILVLDGALLTVQVYSSAGVIDFDFAGNEFNGGAGVGNIWTNPQEIAVDSNNRILVYDRTANTIQVYDSSGNFVFTFDGDDDGNEVPNQGVDGTPFSNVVGIATDSNNRIIAIDAGLNVGQIYTSAGIYVGNLTGGTTFTGPEGVAVDSNDRILAVDFDFDLVQVYSSSGAFDFSFTGVGVGGGGTALTELTSIAVDTNDRIIVAGSC